ncbi:MAG: 1,4-alpha-glucan branching enzyme, partial [Pyrinomonadaceae bacterium]
VMAHPYGGSWGYQVTSFYAPVPSWGTPDEFRQFVDTLHGHGIGVLLDWVPAHFPRDEWALARFDGTDLYEHAGPRGSHPDWGTLVFNYGRNEVRSFLLSNAMYWVQEFHVDGLRVDAVASMLYLDYSRKAGEWVPNVHGGREDLDAVAFLQDLNRVVHAEVPGTIAVAEESTAWPGVSKPTDTGGLGFGFKWNMGWMHDTLAYFQQDPIHRKHHHGELTFSLVYAFDESFVLPLSHDEVVHGKRSLLEKMPGDRWQQMANLRALYAYMWAHPGKQLLFMGGEIAQEREWSEERSLDWHLLARPDHAGVQGLVRDLNRTYRRLPALWEVDGDPAGFTWLESTDADRNVVAFVRRSASDDQQVVCVANLRALYAYMWAHPGKQLLFMGGEIAQEREWSEERSLDWHLLEEDEHRGVSTLVRDLNRLVVEHPALHQLDVEPRGFQWVDVNNHLENVLAFMRQSAAGDRVVCVSNFAAVPRPGYRFGLPEPGTYRLLLNTDSSYYSGGDRLHIDCVETEEQPWHGLPYSAVVDIPPLTTLLFGSPVKNANGVEHPDACAPPEPKPPVPVDTGSPVPLSQEVSQDAQTPKATKATKSAPSKRKAAPAAGDAEGAGSSAKKSSRKSAKRSPRKQADEEERRE